ncbi:MAG: RND transporter [Magnetococcales bacterium]|nr:RND transporter [Magnetococcales bacterium]
MPSLSSFLTWLDQLSWPPLLLLALLLGLAPFVPEPHLWEKLKMLANGTLSKPIDIFDLCMHSTPILLVLLKLWRQFNSVAPGSGA